MTIEVYRGDVFSVNMADYIDDPGHGVRPCVIVSCDLANRYSDAVTIVPITSRIKKPLPTHVRIGIDAGLYKPSTILCEKITTMKKRYLGHYIGSIRGTRVESELNAALHAALSLPHEGG